MIKVESKEKLAKLLAMEDIDVEHRQVKTAMFDVKNRCLVLPTWKDMPNHLYDLLVGHEVGHALYTPSDENILSDIIKKTSKSCVNVVEDARIESLMKRRYPGLVKQFYTGYNHLIEQDFFGLSTMDVSRINFLDKINLHFKIPNAIAGMFEFSDEEQVFIDRIANVKKFSEVEKVCIDLCEYIKENRQEQDEDESIFPEDSYTMTDESNDDTEESDSDDTQDVEENQKETGSSMDDEEESDDGETDGSEDLQNDASNGSPDKFDDDSVKDDLESKTYDNFENNVNELADIDKDNEYYTIPEKVCYDNLIDYKEVYKNINNYYSIDEYSRRKEAGNIDRYDGWYHTVDDFDLMTKTIFKKSKVNLEKIKKESIKNVNHMAMEFERKKSADIYKRTSFAKTGVLDTNKMFSARYNDDIFKKNMRMPEGKNHGLVMFIDWSGSMSSHLQGCVKQLIEFVLFCKKVNIPFEVYSFTDVHTLQNGNTKNNTFIYKHGDIVCDKKVTFRNYFSSRMNARELNDAMLKICVIADSFTNGYQHYPIPEEDRLGYTPLNGAVMFSEHVIRNFQKKNNIQEVHAIWITDGEGNHEYHKHDINKAHEHGVRYNRSKFCSKNVVIQDKKMKKNYPVSGNRQNITPVLFNIVKDRLGCNVVGFFLDMNYGKKYNMMNHFYKSPALQIKKSNDWLKESRKAGYFVKPEAGYDEYYVISNAPKIVKPVEMDDKMTNRKLATVFSAKNNEFKNSRVILSKFIDLITV